MNAKETVMDRDRMLACSLRGRFGFDAVEDILLDACIAQAEITAPIFFKAGQKEMVKWVRDNHTIPYPVGSTGYIAWQAKLKELK